MSEMDSPYDSTFRRFFTLILLLGCTDFRHFSATDAAITETFQFDADCLDGDGAVRGNLDTWTSSAGACDQQVCRVDGSINHKLTYTCPELSTNVDPTNCETVSNNTLPFPGCCKIIQCGTGTLDTPTYPACYDRHHQWVCDFWRDNFGCAASSDPDIHAVYEFTLEYCQQTCGHCVP